MWATKVRGSILTTRLVTKDERWKSLPEKLMLVIVDDRVWCGVPTRMASVFEPLSCRKLAAIHTFISSRQVESVDGAAEGVGFVLM